MKKFKLLLPIIACLFCACRKEIPNVIIDSNNFVMGYLETDEIASRQYKDFPNMIEISGRGNMYFHKDILLSRYEYNNLKVPENERIEIEEKHEKFLKFAQKNNDVNTFNSFFADIWAYENHVKICWADDFTKISITSNADFDEKHLAGAELGDLVTFFGFSFFNFVKNDYNYMKLYKDAILNSKNDSSAIEENLSSSDKIAQEIIDDVFYEKTKNPYTVVYKRVSELTADDLKMLDYKNSLILIFPETAPKEKKHRLKITFFNSDGKEFTTEYIMNFN